jgi:hypothetical protein
MTEENEILVRSTMLPYQWERVIGENRTVDLVNTFSDITGWFDVSIYNSDMGYRVTLKRGPEHPLQDEIDQPLREQCQVDSERVEWVATAFMLCAGEIDPHTNKFTRGMELSEIE